MTDLVKYEQTPAAMSLSDVMTLGQVLVRSGYFDGVKDQAQAVVKILYGQEIGIGPIAAMRSVYIVNGKPSLDAGLIASLIKRSGRYDYRVIRHDDEGCELRFFEHGKEIGVSSYTRKDAQQAGAFDGKNAYNYKKHPRNMYFARAITNGARWYTADIFSGPIYTRDELDDSAPVDVTPTPLRSRSAPAAVDTSTGEVLDAECMTADEAVAQERDQAIKAMREAAKKVKRANPDVVLPGKDDVAVMTVESIRALTEAMEGGYYGAQPAEAGADFEPVESGAPAEMLTSDLPSHL